jgi:L-cysteine desulfidase
VKNDTDIVATIREEMALASGCTEPVAVALACSRAYREIGGGLERIEVLTDPGIYKNGLSCIVPGTEEVGLAVAATLGALAGRAELELEVLRYVTDSDVAAARHMVERGAVGVHVKKGEPDIYIAARVSTSEGWARVLVRKTHTNVVQIEVNGESRFQAKRGRVGGVGERHFDVRELSVADMVRFAAEVPFEAISFVLEAVRVNKILARLGLEGKLGIGVGRGMSGLLEEGEIADDLVSSAQLMTASAVDARMGGARESAMSIAGSGSHGIIATMPIVAIAEKKGIGDEVMARAIALSYLVTIYVKAYSGRLSALCGCAVAAGAGASAGIAFLLGGNGEQIEHSIINVAADITGIICDGGNLGCAMKAATGAGAAVLCALLALRRIHVPGNTGIVAETVERTIANIGRISSPGMLGTNEVILDVMMEGEDMAKR